MSRPLAIAAALLVGACSSASGGAPSASSASSASAATSAAAAPSSAPSSSAPKAARRFVDAFDVSSFAKGNLHTHSRVSDGDSPPRRVYEWYRDHGYAFVALTDHNQRVDPAPFRELEKEGFVILPGEEVTMGVNGTAVHVNAICTRASIGTEHPTELYAFLSNKDALRWAIDRIAEQGAVALVNHPNYMWALTFDDLRGLPAAPLLEVWSGHPHVHPDGDGRRPSAEGFWKEALAHPEPHGVDFAPVAVDDTHNLHGAIGQPAPGRGWVQVFTTKIDEASICDALLHGRLYASSGAELSRVQLTADALSVWPTDRGAKVEFFGATGLLAAPAPGEVATYRLRGDELYVRARITAPNAARGAGRAWTRAYRTAAE